jgi:dipeptidyl aminopeptidase/acylaminoacyl peptidase
LRNRTRSALAALAALALIATPSAGQSAADFEPEVARSQPFELTIRSIMRGPELVGQEPAGIRWTDDSKWVYFRWKPGGMEWDAPASLYRVPAEGGDPERLSDDEADAAAVLIAGGDLSPDRRQRISSVGGDLYLVDRRSMNVRRLTHTADGEGSPQFSADGESVFYRRGNDLYRLDLESGALTQVVRISTDPERREEGEPEGQRGFLVDQQLELFEHIRRGEARREVAEARREAREVGQPTTIHLKRNERVRQISPTRTGDYVLVGTAMPAEGDKNTVVPDWVTEDGYTRGLNVRSKVGDAQGTSRAGILSTATGEIAWIDPAPEDHESEMDPGVMSSGWNDAGTRAFVFATSFDRKDRWIWSVDPATGEKTLLDHLYDDAWVEGPCFSNCVGFIPGTDRVFFVGEETGYAHIYVVNADGSGRQALTSGQWEVLGVTMPEDQSRFLLTTNQGSPFNQHLSWMDFDGANHRPITEGEGRYAGTLSPDGRRIALVHDIANRPQELFLAETRRPDTRTQVTYSPTEEWQSFDWIKPEIIRFPADDGSMVPARIYRPSDMGAEANGAGVVFVHGAGYLHNVHNYWSSYYREYMFNHFLAANGYTVMDIDYRGSAGYGRDWRTGIYRWMGGKDLSDHMDGARYLVQEEGVDAARVGLYGGSYGGFITLMALFTGGDTFKAGAALRSVTDWAHYNHWYTSRILNLPQDDKEAYEMSSPIYFAEDFRPDQHLLILHGMVDTNVHFSDVVRLSQRLIELGKENWELAVYPVEGHGFTEPTSWTDEYRRIYELFERTIREPGCTDGGGFCAVRQAGH